MAQVTATDLKGLRENHTSDEILAMVRDFYEQRDKVRLSDADLFLRAYRTCECVYQNETSEAAAREIVALKYADFLQTGEIPLFVARCLLPGFIGAKKVERAR